METGGSPPELSQPLPPCVTAAFYNVTVKAAADTAAPGRSEIQNFCTL